RPAVRRACSAGCLSWRNLYPQRGRMDGFGLYSRGNSAYVPCALSLFGDPDAWLVQRPDAQGGAVLRLVCPPFAGGFGVGGRGGPHSRPAGGGVAPRTP